MNRNSWVRMACLPLLSLTLVLLLATPGSALTVRAPEYVLTDKVPFAFADADAGGKVILKLGSKTYQNTITVSSFNITAVNVTAGYTHWTVNYTHAGIYQNYDGYVYYDTSFRDMQARMTAMSGSMDKMQGDVGKMKGDVSRINGTVQQDHAGQNRLAGNVTQLRAQLSNSTSKTATDVVAKLQKTNLTAGDNGKAQQAAESASTSAAHAAKSGDRLALYLLAGAAILGVLVAAVLWELRRKSQEQLLVLLALAGHDGITPQSPEYQKALEAVRGVKKPKKIKKVKAA